MTTKLKAEESENVDSDKFVGARDEKDSGYVPSRSTHLVHNLRVKRLELYLLYKLK